MLKPSYNKVIYITTIRTYHMGANILYLNQCIITTIRTYHMGANILYLNQCYKEGDLCNLFNVCSA